MPSNAAPDRRLHIFLAPVYVAVSPGSAGYGNMYPAGLRMPGSRVAAVQGGTLLGVVALAGTSCLSWCFGAALVVLVWLYATC
jgi:hypothetical protein